MKWLVCQTACEQTLRGHLSTLSLSVNGTVFLCRESHIFAQPSPAPPSIKKEKKKRLVWVAYVWGVVRIVVYAVFPKRPVPWPCTVQVMSWPRTHRRICSRTLFLLLPRNRHVVVSILKTPCQKMEEKNCYRTRGCPGETGCSVAVDFAWWWPRAVELQSSKKRTIKMEYSLFRLPCGPSSMLEAPHLRVTRAPLYGGFGVAFMSLGNARCMKANAGVM